jgi:uncharacterized protein involved in exopolysaccharide biosynthesis
MSEQKPQIIPVQYIPYCEEDEIDIKEIIKKLLSYKKFIIIFTLTVTVFAAIYAFLKKPIYEIKADIKLGSIITSADKKINLLNPSTETIYIKNTYDHSNDTKIKYPKVSASIAKGTKNIISLTIDDFSNPQALNLLNKIIDDLRSQENKYINNYKQNITYQLKAYENQKNIISQQISYLQKQLKTTKDPNIYQSILSSIADYQKQLLNIDLEITNLKTLLLPSNFIHTSIIGKIIKFDHPVKPKKKLIIIVAFITGFILSIFLVFFIEFVKGLKEE